VANEEEAAMKGVEMLQKITSKMLQCKDVSQGSTLRTALLPRATKVSVWATIIPLKLSDWATNFHT
jgi:hypothetical protein